MLLAILPGHVERMGEVHLTGGWFLAIDIKTQDDIEVVSPTGTRQHPVEDLNQTSHSAYTLSVTS